VQKSTKEDVSNAHRIAVAVSVHRERQIGDGDEARIALWCSPRYSTIGGVEKQCRETVASGNPHLGLGDELRRHERETGTLLVKCFIPRLPTIVRRDNMNTWHIGIEGPAFTHGHARQFGAARDLVEVGATFGEDAGPRLATVAGLDNLRMRLRFRSSSVINAVVGHALVHSHSSLFSAHMMVNGDARGEVVRHAVLMVMFSSGALHLRRQTEIRGGSA